MRRVLPQWLLLAILGPAAMLLSAAAAEGPTRVPQDQPDLQAAVEAAEPGEVILLDRGTYPGGVIVPQEVHDITIRGVDRNAVIFNGGDVREYAIYVEGDGVALENMTAHNFKGNGFYWEEVKGFIGRYLTVYNVGLYGIYAIESRGGLFEHSLVSGAADAAFYIGECNPCDTVLTNLMARLSAVGYSGTNASGNLVVKDSRWELNGAGILPNSYDVGIAEPPQRGGRFTGNVVRGSGTVDVPVNTPLSGFRGIGIGIAGGSDNVVMNNTVEDSTRYGIAVFSTVDAKNTWTPEGNRIASNDVRGSGVADLVLAAGSGEANCFEENRHDTALPPSLSGPCDASPAGSEEVAGELVLPPPQLAERDPALERAPSYTEMKPPGAQPLLPGIEMGDDSGTLPFGVAAVVVGAALLVVRLSGRGPALLMFAGGILVAAGFVGIVVPVIEGDRDMPEARPAPRPTVESLPSGSAQGEPAYGDEGQLTVVEVSTLDRLPGTQGETHEPKKGKAFLVVGVRLKSTEGPAELSSEQARIVSADGETLRAIGAGEDEFCVECEFAVSSDGVALLGFVFVIETAQMDETFSFRYEGFPEILISASGDIDPAAIPVEGS
jgi:hypothetical protein